MIWLIKVRNKFSQVFSIFYLEKYHMGAAHITGGSQCLVLLTCHGQVSDGIMMAALQFQTQCWGAPVHIPKWPIQVASLSLKKSFDKSSSSNLSSL